MVQEDLSSLGIATSWLIVLEPQFPNKLNKELSIEIFKEISSSYT